MGVSLNVGCGCLVCPCVHPGPVSECLSGPYSRESTRDREGEGEGKGDERKNRREVGREKTYSKRQKSWERKLSHI